MRTHKGVWKLIVGLVITAGILIACGGPEATEPPVEAQPTALPTEVPQEEEPTAPPTEVPQEEEPAPPPTEVPQEEQPTEPPPAGDGAALLEERCTVCHGLDRTTSAQKTREEWEQTVARMVGKGAELNEEEQEILIAYLTETYGP
jgi:outer membrane biosynthesis protein TonB